jgi:hypothetical protein
VIRVYGFFMYVSGTSIKFPDLWEQNNKSLIPLANSDMIAQDCISYWTITANVLRNTPIDYNTSFPLISVWAFITNRSHTMSATLAPLTINEVSRYVLSQVMKPPQLPISQQPKKLPVCRYRLPALIPMEQSNTSPETRSTLTTSVHTDTISINAHQACINNDQASKAEASETDPATQSVNPYDSSPHTPARQPRSEAVTHPPQPPVTDIKPNVSRADCSNNELVPELAAECLHILNDCKRNWPTVSTE